MLRGAGRTASSSSRGRYLEVEGPERSLLIPLGDGALHIGRGLSADLRLDDMSVSRRHAILLTGPGARASSTTAAPTAPSSTECRVQQAELEHGDVIALGRFLLRYLESSSAPGGPRRPP